MALFALREPGIYVSNLGLTAIANVEKTGRVNGPQVTSSYLSSGTPLNLLKLLVVSTPVGKLGSGLGGGVELTLANMTQVLQQRGHQIHVVAPTGSVLPMANVIEISGNPQPSVQTQGRKSPIAMPDFSLLSNMWDYVRIHQQAYDLIINVAYDWLPFYLTPFLHKPVAHLVSMGSLNDVMDHIIAKVVDQFPGSVSVYTPSQADTFTFGDRLYPIGCGLDLSLYDFCDAPHPQLCWLGRISPEKALEDAVEAAFRSRLPLLVMGKLQDQSYFEEICTSFPADAMTYLGFKSTRDMQSILRTCQALVVTPRWVEAFGIVMIEALACGVPVIAYDRGGPAEIVRSGETGWLVPPDNIDALVEAIQKIPDLNRKACRWQAEQEFSLAALGDRIEQWLTQTLQNFQPLNYG